MTDNETSRRETDCRPGKTTLTLKRTGVEQGVVRQSFSHGRTKR